MQAWPNTVLTELLKIRYPIIQAPMAGSDSPALVASVSNAGGLGSLGAAYMKPEAIQTAIKKIRELTDKPFNINLFIPEAHTATEQQISWMHNKLAQMCSSFIDSPEPVKPPYAQPFAEQIAVVLAAKVPVFSFTFGMLSTEWIIKLKANGTRLIGTATTLTEAMQLADNNIDIIVAQGSEAGGHRGTFMTQAEDALIGNFALIPQIVDRINKPIVAAGGIMDGRGIVAALVLGACGVQMGTAFLSCPEAGINEKYRELLLKTKQDNTTLTRAFSGRMARGIHNKFIEDMAHYPEHILPFPIQNALTRPMRNAAAKNNLTDYLSLWAGQASYLSHGITADKLIRQLAAEVQQLLKNL